MNKHGLDQINVAGSWIALSFFDDQGIDPMDAFVTLSADKHADPETLLARAEAEAARKAARAEVRQKIAAAKSGGVTRVSKGNVVETPPAADDGQDESEE